VVSESSSIHVESRRKLQFEEFFQVRVLFAVSIGSGRIRTVEMVEEEKFSKFKIGLQHLLAQRPTFVGIMEQKIFIVLATKAWLI
jgi:hypothetical protein